jgi:hypothetical protein
MKKRRKSVPQPNFLRKLSYLRRVGALPVGVSQVNVYHDDGCAHFQGQACNCNCEVKVRWSQPAAAQN